jgi:DUSP domain
MKSHLSHIMPVWKACEILGEPTVMRIGSSLLRLRESANSTLKQQHQQQQQNAKEDGVIEQEMQVLTAALFYRPPVRNAVDPLEDPMGVSQQEPSVPTHISASWKRWLSAKALQLDKATLLPFMVPHAVQPSGAGHMGLFDCIVYALQGHAVSSTATYYGGSNSNTIWIPDVLILLAVCNQYRDYRRSIVARNQNDDTADLDTSAKSTTIQDQKIIWTMALLTYRIYDSYMKKGTVTRDTVHRFMTDIYGEDSYKRPNAAALLDAMFYSDTDSVTNPLQAVVTEQQFCKRCLDTVRPDTGSHLLLDWVAVLGNAMMPLERIPASITAYLEAMNSTRPPLCQIYDLADTRLYEIKRRFHSLVQQQGVAGTSPLIQGDPMTGSSVAPDTMDPNQSTAASRHVITEAAFCHGVSTANEELGTGGYLPVELAALVFRAGCQCGGGSSSVPGLAQTGWGLYHVMQFGCIAVRHDIAKNEDPDLPLLRFLFGMFQLSEADDNSCDDDNDKHILTRPYVARLVLRLMEYAEFRRRADSSPLDLDDEDDETGNKESETSDIEDRMVSLATAVVLGLLQRPEGSKPSDSVSLRTIVDNTMKGTAVPDQMTFEEFSLWHRTSDDMSKRRGRGRLGPLMMELRLIAGVKFGIPPTLASMEVALIAEIERRHKKRYPQSEVSRRGPRGTVWNIIDATWFKSWATFVNKVAGTTEDPTDGRGDPRNDRVRGLVRISNTGLLVENGSLSLRPDIRWKHDYELLPPLAWSALQAWYDGGPPIHRSVVKYIANSGATASPHSSRAPMPTENEIELYPYFVTVYLCDAASRGEARPFQQNFQLSRVSPILVMLVQLCKELDVAPDSARLWVMGSSRGHSAVGSDGPSQDDGRGDDWILSFDMNIVEQRKRRGVAKDGRITLLLELKDRDTGLWPRGVDGKEWAFREGASPVQIPTDVGDGVVGLYNMG